MFNLIALSTYLDGITGSTAASSRKPAMSIGPRFKRWRKDRELRKGGDEISEVREGACEIKVTSLWLVSLFQTYSSS